MNRNSADAATIGISTGRNRAARNALVTALVRASASANNSARAMLGIAVPTA